MTSPVLEILMPILHEFEQEHRIDPDKIHVRSYADPYSPLGNALRRRKIWTAYLECKVEVPDDLKRLSGAPYTISWGLTGAGIGPDTVWTRAKGDEQSLARAQKHINETMKMIKQSVNPQAHEIAAVTSLGYNIGSGKLASSTLMKKLNAGDRAGAAKQFHVWNRAGGVVSNGLVRRRAWEANVFLGKGN